MRAVLLSAFGEPDRLATAEWPVPEPGPDDILIRTAGAGVNPVDLQTRAGQHAAHSKVELPMVLGWDVAGTVVEVGARVRRFAPGDPVVAMSAQMATGRGTYADHVVVAADIAAPAPRSIALADAAALPLAGLTADQALDLLDTPPGGTLLVTGAAGAVGGFVVQLAVARGLRVLAVARARDEALLKELGAERVVTDETIPRGAADALVETAGLPGAIAGVRDGGTAISIVPTRPPLTERGIDVRMSFVEQDGTRLARLVGLVDEGTLTVRVAERLDFSAAAEAHRRLAAGGVRGKLVLVPAR
ncbi:NADP-dependent oxidoreductase [Micromonospora sp. WMMD712]|uniref:NADP-dependent oxidoreductase n=1 Tax=Micromonospora sp. WMMD712 TaxID=3016096 RepID=UPI00249CABD3|nr:NADP-dependent oxidoreductase [Micromonospora sp. WMMD712]WFE57281.1 NADP-dependent oxidoreductase [Micromonospora sp. WMMD712]